MIPVFERAKAVHALDRTVTVIGYHCFKKTIFQINWHFLEQFLPVMCFYIHTHSNYFDVIYVYIPIFETMHEEFFFIFFLFS
jgi:hypothetical protein